MLPPNLPTLKKINNKLPGRKKSKNRRKSSPPYIDRTEKSNSPEEK